MCHTGGGHQWVVNRSMAETLWAAQSVVFSEVVQLRVSC